MIRTIPKEDTIDTWYIGVDDRLIGEPVEINQE